MENLTTRINVSSPLTGQDIKINKPERVFSLQVLWRELDIFKILEIFWKLFGFFWRYFFEGNFLGRIFLEDFFWRNYLVEINKEFMFLSRFWGNFVSMRRKEGRKNFRSLEVWGKLIALKKVDFAKFNFSEKLKFVKKEISKNLHRHLSKYL